MRRRVFLGGLVLLFPNLGNAEEAPFTPRLELAAGAEVLLATGDFCDRVASDVVMCDGRQGYAGAALGVRSRIARHWSVGVNGAYSWSQSSDGLTPSSEETQLQHRLWRIGAEGRWHFLGNPRFDPYVELGLGVVKSWNVADSGASPGVTVPSVAAAVGFEHPLMRHLSLGMALRTQFLAIERMTMTEQRETGSVLEGPVLLWSLGITATGWYP